MKIIQKYKDVFEGIGKLEGEISLETNQEIVPVIQQPRRIPIKLREALKEKLKELEQDGIIIRENNHTDWTSNILIVKRNEKFRICLDPSELNVALKAKNYIMPKIDEILPELTEAKVFSTLDAKNGFWQLVLNEKSSKYTTFWTPFGRYRWLRLPFGISPAMEIFQKRQHEILQGLKGVEVIADDLLVYGKGHTEEEAIKDHDKNLEDLLIRMRAINFKLNIKKMKLCQKEIRYFGHIISKEGIKPDPAKIACIQKMAKPQNKQELLRILGLFTYMSKFIQNFSEKTHNMRNLTKEENEFNWTDIHEKEFNNLKQTITTAPILAFYDQNKPLEIQTDASAYAIGCVLIQKGHPIAFASRVLKEAELNYAAIEKETLAVLFALKRFDQYVCGKNDIRIETDHRPLVTIFKKSILMAPKRMQKMMLYLQRYNFQLSYTRGSLMLVADCISRAPLTENELVKDYDIYKIQEEEEIFQEIKDVNHTEDLRISNTALQMVKDETKKDVNLQKVMNFIWKGWPNKSKNMETNIIKYFSHRDEISLNDGILYKGRKIIIPESMRQEVLRKLHLSHQGIEATIKLAKELVYWPNISKEIKQMIEKCETCLKYSTKQQNTPMLSHRIPEYPFQRINMDIMEMVLKGKIRRFIITVDQYSDFFEIDEIIDMTAQTIINICRKNFSRHGIPEICITDNAKTFVNAEFQKFAKDWEFQHATSSPYHQQGNGKAEATVKIAKSLIKKSVDSGADFYQCLLQWRNTPNKMNYSPAQRIFSRNLRSVIPTARGILKTKTAEDVKNKIIENRRRVKFFNDRGSRELPELKHGQEVFVKLKPTEKQWEKGEVVTNLNNASYIVEIDGRKYRRNRIHMKTIPSPDSERRNTSNHQENKEYRNPPNENDNANKEQNTIEEQTANSTKEHRERLVRKRTLPIKYRDYQMD